MCEAPMQGLAGLTSARSAVSQIEKFPAHTLPTRSTHIQIATLRVSITHINATLGVGLHENATLGVSAHENAAFRGRTAARSAVSQIEKFPAHTLPTVWGFGLIRVQGSGFRVQGSGLRVEG